MKRAVLVISQRRFCLGRPDPSIVAGQQMNRSLVG
jgi:hypothetical protein